MINFKSFLSVGLCLLSFGTFANDSDDLRVQLSKFNALQANFVQDVVDVKGKELASSEGMLYLKKPKSFMMHTTSPDDIYLYTQSDGIYYYDTFIEQVSIYDVNNLDNQPFALLYSLDSSVWDRYNIKKEGKNYILTPKHDSSFKQVTLVFNQNYPSTIILQMNDGNINTYTLSNIVDNVDDSAFHVTLDANIEINDER